LKNTRALVAVPFLLLVAIFLAGVGIVAYPLMVRDRICPGISVAGIDVGGLTAEAAAARLVERLPDPSDHWTGLRAGGHFWRLSWAEGGQGYDYAGMAAAAYEIGHAGGWPERTVQAWRVRLQGHTLPPAIIPADPARVIEILERVSPLIAVAPVEADLQIGPAGVVARDGTAGLALDLENSVPLVLRALADGAAEVELLTVPVPPRLAEPQPAHAQAQKLLSRPFVLVADDLPTDYHAEFVVPPERMAGWVRAVRQNNPDGTRLVLQLDTDGVLAWLNEIAPQLGEERLLDVPQTLMRVWQALVAGQHTAQASVRHPERRYIVEPGDNLFDIAYNHGFPRWLLEQANPDVDPSALEIGMELVIPSLDVLIPEPVAPGKLIEISLPEQRLRAYEDGELTYDFTCSSGMSSTPTIAGQFQVVMKEDLAYARRWDLDMPFFMGIYTEGPGFYNGIHELPISGNGRRLWSSVLGWPASYGCIILDIGDAETLYNWAPIGTLVRIHGVAPGTPFYRDEPPPASEAASTDSPPEQAIDSGSDVQ
jgi:lipoprotein-anchoring transpeptidase ErfK/SrfK